MNSFAKLTTKENNALLKFPAYISMLAALSNDKLDEEEKNSAINFAHTKTYSCDPLLSDFFIEAEKVFEKNIEHIEKSLPKDNRNAAIKNEIANLQTIAMKLGDEYTTALNRSMNSFTEHVSKAHSNLLADFVFPFTVLATSDKDTHGDKLKI